MIRRSGALAVIVGIVIASRTFGVAEDVMPSWYPVNPGDTWVYQKESLDGDMVHPIIERWTTEEAIVSAVKVPELAGALVTKKTKVLSDLLAPGYLRANDWAKRELPESHLLIRRNCVYLLDGLDAQDSGCDFNVESTCLKPLDRGQSWSEVCPHRDDLLRGRRYRLTLDVCFPMQSGSRVDVEAKFRTRLQPRNMSGAVGGLNDRSVWTAGGKDVSSFDTSRSGRLYGPLVHGRCRGRSASDGAPRHLWRRSLATFESNDQWEDATLPTDS